MAIYLLSSLLNRLTQQHMGKVDDMPARPTAMNSHVNRSRSARLAIHGIASLPTRTIT